MVYFFLLEQYSLFDQQFLNCFQFFVLYDLYDHLLFHFLILDLYFSLNYKKTQAAYQLASNQLQNEKEGFLIKGFAEDVNEVMQNAKVCLAPIRFGAGLKGKLVDAMQNGTPCITTEVGAEGMFGGFDVNGFIEDTPQEFANKTVQLYQDESLWTDKQQNGFLSLPVLQVLALLLVGCVSLFYWFYLFTGFTSLSGSTQIEDKMRNGCCALLISTRQILN